MSEQISVDWTACRGRGTCSELLPERITLDEWGFPIVDPSPVPAGPYAKRAVKMCPTRALKLIQS